MIATRNRVLQGEDMAQEVLSILELEKELLEELMRLFSQQLQRSKNGETNIVVLLNDHQLEMILRLDQLEKKILPLFQNLDVTSLEDLEDVKKIQILNKKITDMASEIEDICRAFGKISRE